MCGGMSARSMNTFLPLIAKRPCSTQPLSDWPCAVFRKCMSNVLPLSAQKSVWSFYRSRFLFVGSIAAILVAILAFAALLPAYMATRSLGKSLGDSESMLPASEEDQNERALILRARTLISELAPVAERPGVFEALTEALEARPNGIVIQRMQIKKEDRQTIVI